MPVSETIKTKKAKYVLHNKYFWWETEKVRGLVAADQFEYVQISFTLCSF